MNRRKRQASGAKTWLSRPPVAQRQVYSVRKAIIGSVFAAFRAGIRQAINATMNETSG
jgi:hypothetical protein